MSVRYHVHLEPIGGCAGDMFNAAMLATFPEHKKDCWQDLEDAGLLSKVSVELNEAVAHGLTAHRLFVRPIQPASRTGHYSDICEFLANSGLHQPVKEIALNLLTLLAEAESSVHGVEIEKVHFHEVADWDSLVDIVAAASLIYRTGTQSFSCGPLPMGRGLVYTEHGYLPVPAPATAYLLRDFPVYDDGEEGERVTPTGAAILKYLSTSNNDFFGRVPSGKLHRTGAGAGSRQLSKRPNIIRCLCLQTSSVSHVDHERDNVIEMTCDIDDMTAEEVAVSLDHIRNANGVLDAQHVVSYGKKGRISFRINVLVNPAFEDSVSACIFSETSTLGIRLNYLERNILYRQHHQWQDETSVVRVKSAQRPDAITAKVESDDLAGVPGLNQRRNRARDALDALDFEP